MKLNQITAVGLSWVSVRVYAQEGGQEVDVTDDTTVEMAFMVLTGDINDDPDVADWQVAVWETRVTDDNLTTYHARCLVGPGGTVTLAKGRYSPYVKVSGSGVSPEVPVVFSRLPLEVV